MMLAGSANPGMIIRFKWHITLEKVATPQLLIGPDYLLTTAHHEFHLFSYLLLHQSLLQKSCAFNSP